MPQKVLIVVGPTASGKSALGVTLARKFDGEVISADSRQVYKGLNIGTGKISKKEMRGIPHHLLDVVSPKKQFSAGDFTRLARAVIDDITKRGKLPIVVGGTGFYIDALVGRVATPDVPPDPMFRKSVRTSTAAQLFARLQKADPKRARAMSTASERNNKVRLIRALEITSALGAVPNTEVRPPYSKTLWIGVRPNDEELKARINKRLRERLKKGMAREAQRLHNAGLTYKRMEELGLEYRSLARYLQKRMSRAELETELRSDIWRYARKQLGYWKRNKNITWFHQKDPKKIVASVTRWMKK